MKAFNRKQYKYLTALTLTYIMSVQLLHGKFAVFLFFTLFCPIACVTSMACWLVVCQDPLPVPGQELILKWKILCLENLFYSNSVWSRASHRGIAVSLSKDVPFKYLFWVILVHFKLCFKRKRNKEMKFYFSSCIIFLEQYLFIISND